MQLKKTIEQLKKENEEQQREISMKDDKIKELEQTNKELLKKPKGGIISQISQIRRRRHSYTNRTVRRANFEHLHISYVITMHKL